MLRQGRGQLSNIDRLPAACTPIIMWAAGELRDNVRTQTEIYADFHERLEALKSEYRGELEFVIPSFSAFNRYSMRKAAQFRELDETRRLAAELTQKLDHAGADEVTVMLAEMIKSVAALKLSRHDKLDPKAILDLARATQAAVSAQKLSTERRQKVTADIKSRLDKAVTAVEGDISRPGAAATDGAAVLKKIREEVYSIFEPIEKQP